MDRRIEFFGASITQGVRARGPELGVTGSDATMDYAWLTGKALRADFRQVGIGAQGIGRGGGGEVPPGLAGMAPAAFQAAYLDYLRQIRATWPGARIFAMRPLGGYFASEIAAAAEAAGAVYVDTTGWLAPTDYTDGLHPTYAGHLRVAHRLAPIIAARLGWTVGQVASPRVESLVDFESGTAVGWKPGANVGTVGVSTTNSYDGRAALTATSTSAPVGEWRIVSLVDTQVPAGARDLFAYVSPDLPGGTVYDARLTVTQGGRPLTAEANGLPYLAGFIPWNRLHVNLSGNAPVTEISVSIRIADGGPLSFLVDDVGWTGVVDG